MESKLKLSLAMLLLLGWAACKKVETPKEESEHEAITSVRLIFSASGLTNDTVWFRDPDGDGGNAPTQLDTIFLNANTSYEVKTSIWNETKTPAEDMSIKIIEEADAHELFYLPANVNLSVSKTDKDSKGFPLGLESTWNVGNVGASGSLNFKLMHKPGLKTSNDSPSLGHADIDMNFPVLIQN
ncbi:hypothetical protein MASR2M44_08870 [Bacteroidota bacterium]